MSINNDTQKELWEQEHKSLTVLLPMDQLDASKYKFVKGSVQFPLDQPLLLGLVKKIVKFRIKQSSKSKQ